GRRADLFTPPSTRLWSAPVRPLCLIDRRSVTFRQAAGLIERGFRMFNAGDHLCRQFGRRYRAYHDVRQPVAQRIDVLGGNRPYAPRGVPLGRPSSEPPLRRPPVPLILARFTEILHVLQFDLGRAASDATSKLLVQRQL